MEYVWVGLVWFCVLFEIESCVAKDGLKLIMQLETTLNFWSFDLHLPSAGMPDVPGLYGTGGGAQGFTHAGQVIYCPGPEISF